jgi:hypothetical protein
MELKFAQGIAPLTSSDIPSFGDALGAIFSSAIGSSMNALDPLKHWFLALLHACSMILRFKKHGGWFGGQFRDSIPWKLSRETEILMLVIPSVIGGFPISTWTSFLVRHDPDPLGSALSSLRGYESIPEVKRYYSALLDPKTYRSDNIDLSKLVQDPFSLPFKNPVSQATTLEKSAREWLGSTTKNKDIRSLYKAGLSKPSKDLMTTLISTRPFFPVVAHDLWKISLGGKLEEVTKAFTMTKTISSSGRTFSLHWRLINAELATTRSVISRFRDSSSRAPIQIMSGTNSFDLSERLREYWGLGRQAIQGLSTYHPFDFRIRPTKTASYGVTCTVDQSLGDPLYKRGVHRAFLGGKTRERRAGKAYEVMKDTNVLELQKLVSASTAGGVSLNLRKALNIIAISRSTFTLDELEKIFPHTIGGTIAHRYEQLGSDGRIAPVGNPNLMTNLTFCSDNVPGVSGSKDDYPLAFQQVFSILAGLHRQMIIHSKKNQILPTLTCEVSADDMSMLKQEEILAADSSSPFNVWEVRDNPLVYLQGIRLRELRVGMPPTSAFPVSFTKHLHSQFSIKFLVVNLIINEACRRSPTAYRLDDHALSDSYLPPFDTVVFDNIGEKVLLECSITAGSMLVITSSVQTQGPRVLRYSVSGLSEKWASVIADLWTPHLTRANAELPIITQALKDNMVTGHNRETRKMSFITYLHQEILSTVLSPPSDLGKIPLAYFAKSPKYPFHSPILSSFTVYLWGISYKTSKSGVSLAVKQELRKMRKVLKDGVGSLHTDDVCRSFIRRFLEVHRASIENHDEQWFSIMTKMCERGLPGFDLSPEEMWRGLRQVTIRSGVKRLGKSAQFNYVRSESLNSGIVEFNCRHWGESRPLRYGKIIKDGRAFNPKRMIADHLTIPGGVYSSDGILWGKISFLRSERVLVIGTGSGGIQTLLSSKGVINIGCDYQDNVPTDLLGKLVYIPPEAARFGAGSSIYASESELTQLDFYNPMVIAELVSTYDPSTVCFDLEPEDHHLGMDVYSTIIDSGFCGRLLVKHVILARELSQIVASLKEAKGISVRGVYRLSTFNITDSYRVKVVIDCQLTPGSQVYPNSSLDCSIISQGIYCPPNPAFDTELEINAMLSHVTRGLVRDKKDIKRRIRSMRKTVDDAEASGRGQMSTELFFKYLGAICYCELILQTWDKSYGEQLNILNNRYEKGTVLETGGKRYRLKQGTVRNYNECVLRTIPRMLRLLRLAAPK